MSTQANVQQVFLSKLHQLIRTQILNPNKLRVLSSQFPPWRLHSIEIFLLTETASPFRVNCVNNCSLKTKGRHTFDPNSKRSGADRPANGATHQFPLLPSNAQRATTTCPAWTINKQFRGRASAQTTPSKSRLSLISHCRISKLKVRPKRERS